MIQVQINAEAGESQLNEILHAVRIAVVKLESPQRPNDLLEGTDIDSILVIGQSHLAPLVGDRRAWIGTSRDRRAAGEQRVRERRPAVVRQRSQQRRDRFCRSADQVAGHVAREAGRARGIADQIIAFRDKLARDVGTGRRGVRADQRVLRSCGRTDAAEHAAAGRRGVGGNGRVEQ